MVKKSSRNIEYLLLAVFLSLLMLTYGNKLANDFGATGYAVDGDVEEESGGTISGSIARPFGQVLGAETSVCNWDINTYMRRGHRNDVEQVKILQRDLLNGYMRLNIPVTGFYGPLTEGGVRAFQLAKKDKILTPWGLTLSTGIFYKTTLVEAKNTICPEQILPIPTDLIPWSLNAGQVPRAI